MYIILISFIVHSYKPHNLFKAYFRALQVLEVPNPSWGVRNLASSHSQVFHDFRGHSTASGERRLCAVLGRVSLGVQSSVSPFGCPPYEVCLKKGKEASKAVPL